MNTVDGAPGEMIGDQRGFVSADQPGQMPQMLPRHPVGRTERQADGVQGQRVISADAIQFRLRVPIMHVVFGMNLEPCCRGRVLEDPSMVG